MDLQVPIDTISSKQLWKRIQTSPANADEALGELVRRLNAGNEVFKDLQLQTSEECLDVMRQLGERIKRIDHFFDGPTLREAREACPNFTGLKIRGAVIGDGEEAIPLQWLEQCETLELHNCGVDYAALATLSRLSSLTICYNWKSELHPANPEALGTLTQLRQLSISDHRQGNKSPEHAISLAALTQLEELRENSGLNLSDIGSCVALKTLHVDGFRVAHLDLSKLTQLSEFRVCDPRGSREICGLEHATALRNLNVGLPQLTDPNTFVALTNLENLSLHSSRTEEMFRLDTLSQLQQLSLGGLDKLREITLPPLPKLQKLLQWAWLNELRFQEPFSGKNVEIQSEVKSIDWAGMGRAVEALSLRLSERVSIVGMDALQGLRRLCITQTERKYKIDDQWQGVPFAQLPRLEALTINASDATSLEVLGEQPELRALCLDDFLQLERVPWKQLPKLELLALSHVGLDSQWKYFPSPDASPVRPGLQLAPDATAATLTALDLHGCKIGDNPWDSFPNLSDLQLVNCELAHRPNWPLMQKLETLAVFGGDVADVVPGVEKLSSLKRLLIQAGLSEGLITWLREAELGKHQPLEFLEIRAAAHMYALQSADEWPEDLKSKMTEETRGISVLSLPWLSGGSGIQWSNGPDWSIR